jgi:hypothetical protein
MLLNMCPWAYVSGMTIKKDILQTKYMVELIHVESTNWCVE